MNTTKPDAKNRREDIAFRASRELIASAKLVILKGDESAICTIIRADGAATYSIVDASQKTANYCTVENTVLVTDRIIHGKRSEARRSESGAAAITGVIDALLAHESGHVMQNATGASKLSGDDSFEIFAASREREYQADCLAGRAVAAIEPKSVEAAQSLYSLPSVAKSSWTHGSSIWRAKMFMRGAHTGDC